MKKYTLFLLGLVFVLVSFNIHTSSAEASSGCVSGDRYSRTTGSPCVTPSTGDCSPGEFFSSVTGAPCSGITPVFPPGCTSNTGFSVTTGQPCSGPTSQTNLNVWGVFPEGCEAGSVYNSLTGASCTEARFGTKVSIYGSGFNSNADIFIDGGTYSPVDGTRLVVPATFYSSEKLSFVVPSNAGVGSHKIQVNIQADQTPFLSNAPSLNFVNPNPNGTFPPGCSSNSGYSSTTGLSCDGGGRTRPSVPPASSCVINSFTASPSTLTLGQSSTLSWNASGCTLLALTSSGSNGFVPSSDASGSMTVTPTATTAYTLRASDINGFIKTASATVTVSPQTVTPVTPTPTVSISASPSTVTSGTPATLIWSSTNATSCVASGGWSGNQSTSGTLAVGNLTGNTTFTLTCTNDTNRSSRSVSPQASASTTVLISFPVLNPKPTVILTANPSSLIIPSGQSDTTVIVWSSTNATYCNTFDNPHFPSLTSGSINQSISATTSFSVSCTGSGGTTTSSITVPVQQTQLTLPPVAATRSCSASIYWGDNQYAPESSVAYNGSAKETWSVQGADQVWADCGDGTKQISTGPQSYTFNNLVNNRTCRVWGVIDSNQNACSASATIIVNSSGSDTRVLGAEAFTFTQKLQLGSNGEEVAQLQIFLTRAGYDIGVADGNFGSKTQTAVMQFETANHLTPDGVVGAQVRALLNN